MSLPIGFFAPLPLPMMIPFMGMQSAVMAEQFGTLFQYGKRRISAMSNEEFNALTPEILQIRMTEQLQKMIPEMEKQIQAMSPLVSTIIREFANYIKEAILAVSSPKSGFEQTTGTTITPSETGTHYIQNPDGTTSKYVDGVLVSTTSPTTIIDVVDTQPIVETTTVKVTTIGAFFIPEPRYWTEMQKLLTTQQISAQRYIDQQVIETQLAKIHIYRIDNPNDTGSYTMTRMLNELSYMHGAYNNRYGEWYVAKTQI